MKIPVTVKGQNQVLPVKFDLLCVFSGNQITFAPDNVDFGSVFHKNASRCTVLMQNHSLLPQQFSFTRLPKEVSVLTDNGTGTILAGESFPIALEYRPTQSQVLEDSELYVRLVTGNQCAREIKIGYTANVMKCPIESDKSKIEFPCLPETESAEVVLQLNNTSSKNYTFEVVPPKPSVSGIIVNPLFKPLPANKSTLVSIKYESAFRDLTYWTMQDMEPPAESLSQGPAAGA
jgi:hypothetical protein